MIGSPGSRACTGRVGGGRYGSDVVDWRTRGAATLIAVLPSPAQTHVRHWPPPFHTGDRDTARMVQEISADRIRRTVELHSRLQT